MTGVVYILKSEKTGKYYIGSTNNIDRRFSEHNREQTTSTKFGIPWKIVFQTTYPTIAEAKNMERKIKRMKSRSIIEKIVRDQTIRMGP